MEVQKVSLFESSLKEFLYQKLHLVCQLDLVKKCRSCSWAPILRKSQRNSHKSSIVFCRRVVQAWARVKITFIPRGGKANHVLRPISLTYFLFKNFEMLLDIYIHLNLLLSSQSRIEHDYSKSKTYLIWSDASQKHLPWRSISVVSSSILKGEINSRLLF